MDATAEARVPQTHTQILAVRMTEAVVIAIVAAALSVWGTTLVLSERMGNMQRSLEKVEGRVEKIYNDFYSPRLQAPAAQAAPMPGQVVAAGSPAP